MVPPASLCAIPLSTVCTGDTSSAEPALSTVQQSDRSAGLAAAVLEARAELEQSGSQYIAASNYSAARRERH